MPRIARVIGRIGLALVAAVGLVVLFLALIVLTDGAGSGLVAWVTTAGVGGAAALWRGRRRAWPRKLVPLVPVIVAVALTASVCVPSVPTDRQYPADLPFVATRQWNLDTGSRVAVYHYPPAEGSGTPVVYLHGGAVRSISVLDHRFLQALARQGYDVYAYEHAGGGRSDLLPMDQYGIARSVRDLGAFIDHLDRDSLLVRPWATGTRTSSSRAVSGSIGCLGGEVCAWANAASSRTVTLGAISASPSAAAWMAWVSRAGPASLSRNPRAPALSAPWTYSSRSKVVMTTIGRGSVTSGPARRRVASMPSISGIRMSNRPTSGRSWSARRTASRPSAAAPTTSMSGWASSSMVSPVRTMGWSSAMRTLMLIARGDIVGAALVLLHHENHRTT